MIPVPVKVEGGEKAEQDLRKLERSLDNLSSGATGVGRELRGLSGAAGASVAAITAIGTAAAASVAGLALMANAMSRLISVGSQLSSARTNLDAIASAEFVGRLESAGHQMVTNAELFARANQALTAGADETRVARAFDLISRAAVASGRDVSEAIERITDSLSGGEMSLEDYGVNVLRAEESAEALGHTIESQQGRTIALDNALQQLADRYGETGAQAQNLGGTITQISTAVQNWVAEVGAAIAGDRELSETFNAILTAIQATLPDTKDLGAALARLIADTISGLAALADAIVPVGQAFVILGRTVIAVQEGPFVAIARMLGAEMPTHLSAADRALREFGNALEGIGQVTGRVNSEVQSVNRRFEEQRRAAIESEVGLGRLGRGSDQLVVNMTALESKVGRTEQALSRFNAEIQSDESSSITLVNRLRGEVDQTAGSFNRMARAIDNATEANARMARERLAAGEHLSGGLGAAPPTQGEPADPRGSGDTGTRFSTEQILAAQREFEERQRVMSEQAEANIQRLERQRQAATAARREQIRQATEYWEIVNEGQIRELREERRLHEMRTGNIELRMAAEIGLMQKQQEAREAEAEAAEAEFQNTQRRLNLLEEIKNAEKAAQDAARERSVKAVDDVLSIGRSTMSVLSTITSAYSSITAQQEAAAQEIAQAHGKESQAYKDAMEGVERRKKVEGGFIIAYSSVMAALELANSIKEFASQNYVSGAAHLAAMASYIAAAAVAGSKLGGGAGPAAPVGRSVQPAQRPEAPQRETSDRVQVVNLFAVERPTGPLGQQLERASYERERQGYREQRPAGIGYE